jgi:hypothetical protein
MRRHINVGAYSFLLLDKEPKYLCFLRKKVDHLPFFVYIMFTGLGEVPNPIHHKG